MANKTQAKQTTTKKKIEKKKSLLEKVAKIDKIPKTVADSIPFRGILQDGTIETKPGVFTRSYKLDDVNFNLVSEEEQFKIFKDYMSFLNFFTESVRFEITIFNHEIDKRATLENIRILPQQDGLNKYRQEMNSILISNLKKGNNSIKQDKYLTVGVEDFNVEHAIATLNKVDNEVSSNLRKITKRDTEHMDAQQRLRLLYDIYNQRTDYRFDTGIFNPKTKEFKRNGFDFGIIQKQGLSVKDVVGPSSMDFSKHSMFMLNDVHCQAFYLDRVPAYLKTSFINELCDIPSNMLISMTFDRVSAEKAIKSMKGKVASVEAQVRGISDRDAKDGYYGGSLPPDLEKARNSAYDLLNDLMNRDQGLFYGTMTVVLFAPTQDQLEESARLVTSVSNTHLCPIKPIKFQQEFAFNTALPLCRNDLFVSHPYTTESAAAFIPYNAQEINQKNAIFYGLNQKTKSMVLYDRLSGNNYNGLIFGSPGSGKSFMAKCEMIFALLSHPNSQVFVIDPQGEYYPLAHSLNGEEIKLAPGTDIFINPLDLDIEVDEDNEMDPITMKIDYVISLYDLIMPRGMRMESTEKFVIDKALKTLYKGYIDELVRQNKTFDETICPTLSDLYQLLKMQGEQGDNTSKRLADIIAQYAVGSFSTFANQTNVETNKRFVVYNTKQLGTGMRDLGLFVCLNDVWNRMKLNSKKNIYTWFYIDEFHLLLASPSATASLKEIWKMARKWLGVPTGIMQNTSDLSRDEDSKAIVYNTEFVLMFKASQVDRENLARLFNLSASQLEYITESDPGYGLLYTGKVAVPIVNKFPKDTELYKLLTTAHDVEDSAFK